MIMLYLFGSVARGAARSDSDIDVLLVEWNEEIIDALEPYSLWNNGAIDLYVYRDGYAYSPHYIASSMTCIGKVSDYPIPAEAVPVTLAELLYMCSIHSEVAYKQW